MMVTEHTVSSARLELLRKRINDKDYMHAAIQRLALILSNELVDMSQGGGSYNEWQRQRRR